ncbi:MAG TPA: polysaccharide biosynthesis/export family protein [Vicinamibacterales bacterium]|nr:polysaccharide biosynthesis/export family protein [Vicinamibacterales bacterium]
MTQHPLAFVVSALLLAAPAQHVTPAVPQSLAPAAAQASTASDPGVTVPGDYVIGPDDVLGIVFWRDKDLSADVTVRPDGKITLPLLKEIQAAGLTPAELHDAVIREAKRYVENPNASVIVRQINSRKVYITGEVAKPGAYALNAPMTVMQVIALAGGLQEFAKSKDIIVLRTEAGRTVSYPFSYDDVIKHRRFEQNIVLRPGDTVVVP